MVEESRQALRSQEVTMLMVRYMPRGVGNTRTGKGCLHVAHRAG